MYDNCLRITKMSVERFPNPPIKEAILSVKFKDELSIELIEKFCQTQFINDNYPASRKSVIRQINAGVQGHQEFSVKDLQDGFVLESKAKGERLIQARKAELSYHKIGKYDNWESLIEEFKVICSELITAVGVDILAKEFSVRYINQIPVQEGDLKEYFKLVPMEVDGLPKQVSSMFLQLALPFGDLNGIITETIANSKNDGKQNFIIDLKVINTSVYLLGTQDTWEIFERMRNYKNQLFFSIVTDKIKPLFR